MIGSVRWAIAIVALVGCDAVFRIDHVELDAPGPPGPDAAAPADAFDCAMVGLGFIHVCASGHSTSLMGAISTDNNCQLATSGTSQFCLLTGDDVTVGALTVIGSYPLVIAARHTLTISGFVDASSHDVTPAAGARDCSTPAGTNNTGGAGGGPGGSWRTGGGGGGSDSSTGSTAALPEFPAMPELRGGCRGGPGGVGGANGGDGGYGGGAVYLLAGTAISLGSGARISAAGAGGQGGHQGSAVNMSGGGGGGGGTGGMIVFDAPVITLDPAAQVWANGGGGGAGGARLVIGDAGSTSTQPVSHGAAASPNGGRGATGNEAGVNGGSSVSMQGLLRAAGGGGGGTGWIFYYGATIAPSIPAISPPPSAGP